MLTIYKPEILQSSTGSRVQAEFEVKGKRDVLWYETEEQYGQYLTSERADAFLVGLLGKAIKEGHDITVKSTLSERLYYTLNNYLIPIIANTLNSEPIKVFCSSLSSIPLKNLHAVGTGLSCGIDSFSTIYEHLQDDCPSGYQLTHFTYFNVGSHGSHGGDRAQSLFNKRLEHVKKCAIELGKELVIINSNVSELLQMSFTEIHTLRNIAAVLSIQKLFKTYYYSSSVEIKKFSLNKGMGPYDVFSLSMLATESINLFSTCPSLTRFDKTQKVAHNEIVQRYLNVCIKEGENCGNCIKCARTLLTLEILGEINKFSSIFDLKEYQKRRSRYIISVLARRRFSDYKKEIYDEMKRINFKVPLHLKVISFFAYFKIRFSMIA